MARLHALPRLPLSQTVDTSRRERSWRSSVLSLITSTLVQGVAIGVLIVTPLLVSQTLPAPVSYLKLPDFVIAEIDLPRERVPEPERDRPRASPDRVAGPRISIERIVIPGDFPDDIYDPNEDIWDSKGVDGGMPPGLLTSFQPKPPVEAPEPAGPIRIGGEIRAPRKIVHVNPVYPAVALHARVQGRVTLRAIIDEEGNVVNVSVVHSILLLNRAAIEAVERWKYEPTYLNGKAVPVIMSVFVEFELR